MSRLVYSSANMSFQFWLPISDARTQCYKIISQNKISLIGFKAVKQCIQTLTITTIIHIFFISCIHLFKNIAGYSILTSIGSSHRIIIFTAISTPISHRCKFVHPFTCRDTRRSCDIPASHYTEVFITCTLKKSQTVRRIEIIFICHIHRTFQTVTTDRSHIYCNMIIGSLLDKIIVIKKPSGTIIYPWRIAIHNYTILLYFRLQQLQFCLLFGSKRIHPIRYNIIEHLSIRNRLLRRIIYIRSTVEARQTKTFIIVPATTTQKIQDSLSIITVQSLRPGSTF